MDRDNKFIWTWDSEEYVFYDMMYKNVIPNFSFRFGGMVVNLVYNSVNTYLFSIYLLDSIYDLLKAPRTPKTLLILIADITDQPVLVQGNSNRRSVSTLKPCAKDAYMLFQVFPLIRIIFII